MPATGPSAASAVAGDYFASIVEASPDCIRILDLDGRVEFMNRRGLELFEIEDFSRNRGRYWPALWPETSRPEVIEALTAAAGGAYRTFRAACPTARGTPKWWDTVISPVLDPATGQVVGLLATSRDITAQAAADEALREAVRAAEAASRAKSEFLTNMSHELRTPLNGVVATAQMLRGSKLDPAQDELVDMIARSGATLARLIEAILDLTRLDAGGLELHAAAFDLTEKVLAVAAAAELAANEKGLAFALAPLASAPPRLLGDAARLEQILDCLLSNAVKFTQAGQVALRVTAREASERTWVRFEVSDTGVGFTEEVARRVFDPFEQADGSMTRRFGGSGLGLALARQLATLMGGSLSAAGRPGEGATFVLELPFEAAALPGRDVAAAAHVESRALRVLLAEDHPTNRRVIELILGAVEAELTSVENGQEAVAAWERQDFDVVLMDIQMPVMDGLTAIRTIREREIARCGRTPIIAVTANALAEHFAASAAAGADLHVCKPVTAARLFEGIEMVLGQREA